MDLSLTKNIDEEQLSVLVEGIFDSLPESDQQKVTNIKESIVEQILTTLDGHINLSSLDDIIRLCRAVDGVLFGEDGLRVSRSTSKLIRAISKLRVNFQEQLIDLLDLDQCGVFDQDYFTKDHIEEDLWTFAQFHGIKNLADLTCGLITSAEIIASNGLKIKGDTYLMHAGKAHGLIKTTSDRGNVRSKTLNYLKRFVGVDLNTVVVPRDQNYYSNAEYVKNDLTKFAQLAGVSHISQLTVRKMKLLKIICENGEEVLGQTYLLNAGVALQLYLTNGQGMSHLKEILQTLIDEVESEDVVNETEFLPRSTNYYANQETVLADMNAIVELLDLSTIDDINFSNARRLKFVCQTGETISFNNFVCNAGVALGFARTYADAKSFQSQILSQLKKISHTGTYDRIVFNSTWTPKEYLGCFFDVYSTFKSGNRESKNYRKIFDLNGILNSDSELEERMGSLNLIKSNFFKNMIKSFIEYSGSDETFLGIRDALAIHSMVIEPDAVLTAENLKGYLEIILTGLGYVLDQSLKVEHMVSQEQNDISEVKTLESLPTTPQQRFDFFLKYSDALGFKITDEKFIDIKWLPDPYSTDVKIDGVKLQDIYLKLYTQITSGVVFGNTLNNYVAGVKIGGVSDSIKLVVATLFKMNGWEVKSEFATLSEMVEYLECNISDIKGIVVKEDKDGKRPQSRISFEYIKTEGYDIGGYSAEQLFGRVVDLVSTYVIKPSQHPYPENIITSLTYAFNKFSRSYHTSGVGILEKEVLESPFEYFSHLSEFGVMKQSDGFVNNYSSNSSVRNELDISSLRDIHQKGFLLGSKHAAQFFLGMIRMFATYPGDLKRFSNVKQMAGTVYDVPDSVETLTTKNVKNFLRVLFEANGWCVLGVSIPELDSDESLQRCLRFASHFGIEVDTHQKKVFLMKNFNPAKYQKIVDGKTLSLLVKDLIDVLCSGNVPLQQHLAKNKVDVHELKKDQIGAARFKKLMSALFGFYGYEVTEAASKKILLSKSPETSKPLTLDQESNYLNQTYGFDAIKDINTIQMLLVLLEPAKYTDKKLKDIVLYYAKGQGEKRLKSLDGLFGEKVNTLEKESENDSEVIHDRLTTKNIQEIETKILPKIFEVHAQSTSVLQQATLKQLLLKIAYTETQTQNTNYRTISLYFLDKSKKALMEPLKRLYKSLHEEYKKVETFQPKSLATSLKLYQKEFAYKMSRYDCNSIFNADEAGLGKTFATIAGIETMRQEGMPCRAIIVSPLSVLKQRAEEIGKHVKQPRNIHFITPDSTQEELLEADYCLVNYEFFGRSKSDKDETDLSHELSEQKKSILEFLKIHGNVLVLDEVHRIDNHRTNSFKNILSLASKSDMKKVGLSASLVQSKRSNLLNLAVLFGMSLPKTFQTLPSSQQRLKELIAEKSDEFKLFRENLFVNYIVRRQKSEVFEVGKDIPQLHEHCVSYELTQYQKDLSALIVSNFSLFLKKFKNKKLTDSQNIDGMVLQQFFYLQMVAVMPQLFDSNAESPLLSALDTLVKEKQSQGKKVVLFTQHVAVANMLVERYKEYGAIKLDGETSSETLIDHEQRKIKRSDYNRIIFQDPYSDYSMLIANVRSGGVGLNLSSADTLINVQIPSGYTDYYQCINRVHRMNSSFIEKGIHVYNMLAVRNDGVLTPVQRLFTLLQSSKALYQLMMSGILNEEEFTQKTMKHLLSDMRDEYESDEGFTKSKQFTRIHPIIKKKVDKALSEFELSGAYQHKLYQVLPDLTSQQQVDLLDCLKLVKSDPYKKVQGNLYLELLDKLAEGSLDPIVLNRLKSSCVEPNRMERFGYMHHIVKFNRADLQEKIVDYTGYFKNVPVHIIRAVVHTFGQPFLQRMFLQVLNRSENGNMIFDCSYFFTKFPQSNDQFAEYLSERKELMAEICSLPIKEFTKIFNDCKVMQLLDVSSYKHLLDGDISTLNDLQNFLLDQKYAKLTTLFSLNNSPDDVNLLDATYHRWGGFQELLQFYQAYSTAKLHDGNASLDKELSMLQTCFAHDVQGDFLNFKYQRNGEEDGFIAGVDEKAFFDVWSQDSIVEAGDLSLDTKRQSQINDFFELLQRVFDGGVYKYLEPQTHEFLSEALFLKSDQIAHILGIVRELQAERGRQAYSGKEFVSLIETKEEFVAKRKLLDDLSAWLNVSLTLQQILNDELTLQERKKNLKRIVQFCNSKIRIIPGIKSKRKKVTEPLFDLFDRLKSLCEDLYHDKKYEHILVSESGRMEDILRIGNLFTEKKNCFSPRANTFQNKTVIDKVSNRYKKMITVEANDRAEVTSTLHIRHKDGQLYLFIDKLFVRGGEKFKDALLARGEKKIQQFNDAGIDIHLAVSDDLCNKSSGGVKVDHVQSFFGKVPYEHIDSEFLVVRNGKSYCSMYDLNLSNFSGQTLNNQGFDFAEDVLTDEEVLQKIQLILGS